MKEEQSKQDVRALFHFFSRNIREQLLALPLEADGMEEVRLRVSAPLYYIYKNKEFEDIKVIEKNYGSAGRMWTRRCNARLVLPSMLTGRKSGRGF